MAVFSAQDVPVNVLFILDQHILALQNPNPGHGMVSHWCFHELAVTLQVVNSQVVFGSMACGATPLAIVLRCWHPNPQVVIEHKAESGLVITALPVALLYGTILLHIKLPVCDCKSCHCVSKSGVDGQTWVGP